jgi:predicted transposase YbfD/YdcC
MNEELRTYFAIVDDPRSQCDITYPVVDVLILTLCAVMCGMKTLNEITDYGELKAKMLKEVFDIQAIPSRATLARILALIDANPVVKAIFAFARNHLGTFGDQIAFDGKAIRSTYRVNRESPLQILTAFATESGLTLQMLAIPEKTNEIPKMQEMLRSFNLQGMVVSGDALNTQKETVRAIIEQGGDYVFPVKENHKTFYHDIRFYMLDLILKGSPQDQANFLVYDSTTEVNRNREELRECWVLKDWEPFGETDQWEGLKTIFVIRRTVTYRKTKTVGEWNFYISSLQAEPAEFIRRTRNHWKIESMHWWLDVVMKEDESQFITNNALKTLDAFKKLAFVKTKAYREEHKSKKTLKSFTLQALVKDAVLLELLAL